MENTSKFLKLNAHYEEVIKYIELLSNEQLNRLSCLSETELQDRQIRCTNHYNEYTIEELFTNTANPESANFNDVDFWGNEDKN